MRDRRHSLQMQTNLTISVSTETLMILSYQKTYIPRIRNKNIEHNLMFTHMHILLSVHVCISAGEIIFEYRIDARFI